MPGLRRPASQRPRLEDRQTPRDDREADEQYLEDEAFGAGREGSPFEGSSARERAAWEAGRQERMRERGRGATDTLEQRGGRQRSKRPTDQRDYSDAEMSQWRRRKGLGFKQ